MEMTMNKLGSIIIVSLVLIISIFAVRMWYENSKELTSDEECRVSILTHSNLIKFGLPAKNSDIHCSAKEITLSNSEGAKRLLAEDMKRCWKNYGEGKLNLFKEEEGLLCSVCSIIETKDNLVIDDYSKYLFETNMKGSQQTYASYIADFETKDYINIKDSELYKETSKIKEETITLTKDKRYANVFIYAKGQDAVKRMWEFGENVGVGGGVALAGVGVVTLIATGTALQAIPVVGTISGIILIVGGIGYYAVSEYFSSAKFEHMSRIELIPYSETVLKDMGCQYVPVSLIDE